MKRFIPTIVLVVLCIGAFWYASANSFFKKEEESDNVSKPLVSVQTDDVTAIRIKEGGIEFAKKDGQWTMTKPSALPLDTTSVDGWLAVFSSLTQDGEVDPNPADLAPFGLKDPATEYEVTLKDGSTRAVQVGSPLPIYGHYYAKLKDAPNVYKVSESQVTSLKKTVLDFMNKTPVKLTYNEVADVQLTWKGVNKSLHKNDASKSATESDWKLDGNKDLKGSDVEPMLDKMLYMTTDKQVRPASEISLNTPDFKMEFKSSKDGKETTVLYLGKIENDDVWIVRQQDAWAYAIPAATIQEMFDAVKMPESSTAQ